jgi:hypothetical protein
MSISCDLEVLLMSCPIVYFMINVDAAFCLKLKLHVKKN